MKTFTTCCLTAIASCCAFAATACETPAMITIPDGKSSDEAKLMAAQAEVRAYVVAMQDFMACTDKELQVKGADAPAEYKKAMDTRYAAAEAELMAVTSAFNIQVRGYTINKVLNESSKAITAGDCATFTSKFAKPGANDARSATAACAGAGRANLLSALNAATSVDATYNAEGTRATFDLRRSGVPANSETLVVERVEKTWYVSYAGPAEK